MNRQDALAEAVNSCKVLAGRYLAGFDDATRTKQAMDLPNHAAWCLGHLALTMHRVAEMLDGGGAPEADFIVDSATGDASRFGTESVAFGSAPTDNPAIYPTWDRCREIFNAACDRLARAARRADDAALDRTVTWGGGAVETTVHLLIARMVFHNGMHVGQIVDLRRALGMKSVFAK